MNSFALIVLLFVSFVIIDISINWNDSPYHCMEIPMGIDLKAPCMSSAADLHVVAIVVYENLNLKVPVLLNVALSNSKIISKSDRFQLFCSIAF